MFFSGSFLWYILVRKHRLSMIKAVEQKKSELSLLLDDAEQMLEEMNRFSDYIVTQMEIKNRELEILIERTEGKIADFKDANIANEAGINETAGKELIRKEKSGKVTAEKEITETKKETTVKDADKNTAYDNTKDSDSTGKSPVVYNYHDDMTGIACSSGIVKNEEISESNALPIGTAFGYKSFTEKKETILKLARNGIELIDIAKCMNTGIGEIELIIGIDFEKRIH